MRLFVLTLLLTILSAALALAQDAPKKVTQSEAIAAAVSKCQPDYPAIAKQLKIQGLVELQAAVDEDGKVEQVTIVSGNPVLTKPAADALKKWKFKPFTTDGKPVKVLAPVSFTFKNSE